MLLKKRTFSVNELLIMIALLVMLMSLLQPSLKRINSNAKALQCMSHQARVFSYLKSYSDDNGDLIPPVTETRGGGWNDQITYDDAISIYDGRDMHERYNVTSYYPNVAVGGEEVYLCTEEQATGWRGQLRRSYALNTDIADRWVGPTTWSVQKHEKGFNDIPSPQTVILISEVRSEPGQYASTQNVMSGGQNAYYAFVSGTGGQSYGQYALSDVYAEPWHDSQWNYTFADGHIEKLLPQETLNTANLEDRFGDRYWTKDLND